MHAQDKQDKKYPVHPVNPCKKLASSKPRAQVS